MKIDPTSKGDLSIQISKAIREDIMEGRLTVDDRLPSETDLCDHFNVSRSTVREALKRLAAQNLIRTQRGATGGAFVNRLDYDDARRNHITTSTLLMSMNEVDFKTACEARYSLEKSVAQLASRNRSADHLATMRVEIYRQGQPGLSDESFCDSDVAFHRALVDSAGNKVLSYQLAGAVEATQPLMNMITFSARSREKIIELHTAIADATEAQDPGTIERNLDALSAYTIQLGENVFATRKAKS